MLTVRNIMKSLSCNKFIIISGSCYKSVLEHGYGSSGFGEGEAYSKGKGLVQWFSDFKLNRSFCFSVSVFSLRQFLVGN